MYVDNYLRNRGIFILIILAAALVLSWLVRPQPEIESFDAQGTVIEITEGQLATILVQLENGDRTRLMVGRNTPELNASIQLLGKRYEDGSVLYQIRASEGFP
ncbi:MAG: hypothetical protein JJU48_00680 [Methylophaga sp.]|nr:hypothetical protein [Methylophaga sp.]